MIGDIANHLFEKKPFPPAQVLESLWQFDPIQIHQSVKSNTSATTLVQIDRFLGKLATFFIKWTHCLGCMSFGGKNLFYWKTVSWSYVYDSYSPQNNFSYGHRKDNANPKLLKSSLTLANEQSVRAGYGRFEECKGGLWEILYIV